MLSFSLHPGGWWPWWGPVDPARPPSPGPGPHGWRCRARALFIVWCSTSTERWRSMNLRRWWLLVPAGGLICSRLPGATNLRYGDPDADLERVESVAREACAGRRHAAVPGRLSDSGKGRTGDAPLSGGQRQRAALGAPLMVDAPAAGARAMPWRAWDNNTAAANSEASIREQRDRTILHGQPSSSRSGRPVIGCWCSTKRPPGATGPPPGAAR